MSITNNLYPPIVGTYQPAFVRNETCKVYFSLSNYNSYEDIKNAQVIVNYQKSNTSAFRTSPDTKDTSKPYYSTNIKVTNILIDNTVVNDEKYYIEINPEDLKQGEFEVNQYYKVQVRFTGAGAQETPASQAGMASWLNANSTYFSEWSTVCLIKGISKPTLELKGFEDDPTTLETTIFTTEILDLIGTLSFEDEDESEYLKYYTVKIYSTLNNELVFNSDKIFTEIYNPNEINYTLPYLLEDGTEYRLELTYYTYNEYSNSIEYTFSVIPNLLDALELSIEAEADVDNGRVKLHIKSTDTIPFFGNVTFRRTSSKSNFKLWDDVKQLTFTDNTIVDYTWYDYTIESGVWYKYGIQRRSSKGDRGVLTIIEDPIVIELEDMFLTREDLQFRVKYDPSISSFKTNYIESKTDTIGSQFPFIRRNGNVKYKSFSISGLITSFCDDEHIFLSPESIYGQDMYDNYYKKYNEDVAAAADSPFDEKRYITEYNDYIYERMFREKIMDFLYGDDLKLFRSNTEGNIIVRLMDINFSPQETLGRMLYSFSATAYEMDNCTVANYDTYGIQTIGDYCTELHYDYNKIGQVIDTFTKNDDVIDIIRNKYSNLTLEKYITNLSYLSWVRLQFNSAPYLIKTVNGVPQPWSKTGDSDTAVGYIVNINNTPIIVSARGFYELIDDDTNVTSITFPTDTDVTIDYIAELEQTENTSLLYSKIYYNVKAGQLHKMFKLDENGFTDIYTKYLFKYQAYYQTLASLNEVTIEADPGTVIYVKDSYDDEYFKHEIGATGVLRFYDEDSILTGFYFHGVHLHLNSAVEAILQIISAQEDGKPIEKMVVLKDGVITIDDDGNIITVNPEYFTIEDNKLIVKNDNEYVRDTEYFEVRGDWTSFDEIVSPAKNSVYTINGQRYIYYHQTWYEFSDDDIVQCPVFAIVDYIVETMKGEYYSE